MCPWCFVSPVCPCRRGGGAHGVGSAMVIAFRGVRRALARAPGHRAVPVSTPRTVEVRSIAVDPDDLRRWFDEYLERFVACARGQLDPAAMLEFYGVPLLMTSGQGALDLTSEAAVAAALEDQVAQLRATGYHDSVTLRCEHTLINRHSASIHGEFSRRRADGTEIGRLSATYLVAEAPSRRIRVLAVHDSSAR